MIKILIGGSPCTHWSIAQKNNREIKPEGLGWELFKNYLIAKQKFEPDIFLYENNKSAAQPIKNQISHELGVELQYINSALVSAQNRQRFYAHNIRNVPQPDDRGILLKDILESGASWTEKSYCLTTRCSGAIPEDTIQRHRHSMVAEPIRIGTIESKLKNKNYDSKQYRVYSPTGKSTTLCGQGGGVGAKTGLYACPIDTAIYQIPHGYNNGGIKYDKSPTLTANGSWQTNNFIIKTAYGKPKTVYEVKNGLIAIKDKTYPIKLNDGYYIIRKLTPIECERLQTMPDNYTAGISNTQRYKCLGNGWTAEVIMHILKHASIPRNEEIIVLSMYDGIATGRYCLDKLGYKNITYYASEIDKYAIKIAMKNYPDIIQIGDAFGARNKWDFKVFKYR